MFNSFQSLFLLFLHIQLLAHPAPLKFPPNFPFVKPIYVQSPTPTVTPMPTLTPSSTPTPVVSITLSPTLTPSPTPSSAPSPTSAPSLTPTLTPDPSPTPSTSPSTSPTNIPSPTPTPSLSPTITPTSIPSPIPTPTPEPIGNDISYPQCGKNYPTDQLFGIVGVNGGIASTTNPCLSSQLSWANNTKDSSLNLAKVQLYVNTGNPGGLNTVTWPQNNTDPQGNATSNPYGTCDGGNSIACAWQYGWNRAVDDVISRFIPAANSAGISSDPVNYPWWLDVETANSWRDGSSEALQANAAALEGMVAYFKSRGITIGIYSTSYQWGVIVGSLSSGSNLNGLPNWIPGASDLVTAKSNCQKPPFTSGSEVVLTQYTTGEFDYDYYCK